MAFEEMIDEDFLDQACFDPADPSDIAYLLDESFDYFNETAADVARVKEVMKDEVDDLPYNGECENDICDPIDADITEEYDEEIANIFDDDFVDEVIEIVGERDSNTLGGD